MAKQRIIFDAPFGSERKKVEISLDEGGTWCWTVLVDHFYQGMVCERNGVWEVGHVPPNTLLEAADVQVIGELINEKSGRGKPPNRSTDHEK